MEETERNIVISCDPPTCEERLKLKHWNKHEVRKSLVIRAFGDSPVTFFGSSKC